MTAVALAAAASALTGCQLHLTAGPGEGAAPGPAARSSRPPSRAELLRQVDPAEFLQAQAESAARAMSFENSSRRQAKDWQRDLRGRLASLLGTEEPAARAAPAAVVEDEARSSAVLADGRRLQFRRRRVVFQSQPHMSVVGYLLLPLEDERRSPLVRLPCIICIPGHQSTAADLAGVPRKGPAHVTSWNSYDRDMALRCVARGFSAFVIEPLAFGVRKRSRSVADHPYDTLCARPAGVALSRGETLMGWRARDVWRAVDFLSQRPEIDGNRIAVMGVSVGGEIALFATALDTRIRCAVVSGALTCLQSSHKLNRCVCEFIPGLADCCEMSDVAGLVAPRYLFAENGVQDWTFPVAEFKVACDRAREIYAAFGKPFNIDWEIFDGGHRFHGEKALQFLEKRL